MAHTHLPLRTLPLRDRLQKLENETLKIYKSINFISNMTRFSRKSTQISFSTVFINGHFFNPDFLSPQIQFFFYFGNLFIVIYSNDVKDTSY